MVALRSHIDFEGNKFLMFVIDQIANEKERAGEDVIRMTLGKSELPLNPQIIAAMERALGTYAMYTQVYPAGLPELREAIARYNNEKYALKLSPRNILIGCGTSSIFRNLFQILAAPGDEVLLPLPYYSLYSFCSQLVNAKTRYYQIDLDHLELDLDSFEQNFTEKTKIVVINTPGNPLGNVLTEADLTAIDQIVAGRAVIINDEIYSNTYFDEPSRSVLQLKNMKSTFVTTNAFSKAYRMYTRRVGYCIVPEELEVPLTVIQHHTLLTLDPVVQYGALEALKHEGDVEALTATYRSRRNYTIEKFNGVGVRALPAKGSFYLTLDCTDYIRDRDIDTSLDLAQQIIRATNIATVPGSDFGIPKTLRLSYSTSKYKEGIDGLVDFFRAN
jgi:aspartate/methionine/tyrosine aminotransferase